MIIHIIKVGPISTNCYLVEDEESKEALIIDPGAEADKIMELIKDKGLKPLYSVITHGHWDHIGANKKLKAALGLPILMHKDDLFGLGPDDPLPDRYLKAGDKVEVGKLDFKVIETPGHTPGGISLYSEKEKVLFSGDTLFYGTYGRVDLPFSSAEDMVNSLPKLFKLPPETKVYPGHGRPTTIGAEQGLLT